MFVVDVAFVDVVKALADETHVGLDNFALDNDVDEMSFDVVGSTDFLLFSHVLAVVVFTFLFEF